MCRDENFNLPTAHIVAFIYSKSKLTQYNSLGNDDSSFPNTPRSKWLDYTRFGKCRDVNPAKCLSPALTVALRPDSITPVGIELGKTNATTPQTLETYFTIIGNNRPACIDCLVGIRVELKSSPEWRQGTSWNISQVVVERFALVWFLCLWRFLVLTAIILS